MSTASTNAPVALVTGANKGIGLETARRPVEAGCRVYLSARNSERGQAGARSVGRHFLELDLTSDESVRHAVETVARTGAPLTCWSTTPTSPVRCVTLATTPRTT